MLMVLLCDVFIYNRSLGTYYILELDGTGGVVTTTDFKTYSTDNSIQYVVAVIPTQTSVVAWTQVQIEGSPYEVSIM
jgi:hypothetical protein